MAEQTADGRSTRVERGLGVSIVAVGTFALFVVTAMLAQRLPATLQLGRPLEHAPLDFSVDSLERVAPVRDEFVRTELRGLQLASFALGDAQLATFAVGASQSRASSVPASLLAGPVPSSPSTRTQGDSADRGTVARALAPGNWRLEIGMSADRSIASVGDDIVYTVMLTNVGEEEFSGDFTISSHIPFGTTSRQSGECTLPNRSSNPCGAVVVPVPGEPTSNSELHSVSRSVAGQRLAPGETYVFEFIVTVAPSARPGTDITNHSHGQVAGEPELTSPVVEVRVR